MSMEQWLNDTDSKSRSTRKSDTLLSICQPRNGVEMIPRLHFDSGTYED